MAPSQINNEDPASAILGPEDLKAHKLAETKSLLNKISNHFVFGNQASSSSDALMMKTSNNKLDQSHRISYVEMVNVLKNFKISQTDSIQAVNMCFEKNYFPEWFKLMKYFVKFE